MATQKYAKENTEMGPISSMIRVEMQGRWKGDLYGTWEGGAKPLWEGSQRRRDTPHPPSFSRGRTGGMGRHVTQSIRRGTGRDSGCLQLVFEQRWRTLCRCYLLVFLCFPTFMYPMMMMTMVYPTIYRCYRKKFI